MPRIVSVTSGKGGVGKTLTTINLALSAQASGLRVLVVDGDLGMSNVDVLLGLLPTATLMDVIDGSRSISDVIAKGPKGIDVIPSGSGVARMANLGAMERSCLLHELARLPSGYDVIIVDTGAGISPAVLSLNKASDAIVLVTTPEPHALTDVYAMIKVMAEECGRSTFGLIVNQVRSEDEAGRIAERLADVAKKFCDSRVVPLGGVRSDPVLMRSVMARNVGWDGALHTLAGQGWSSAWRRLSDFMNKGIIGERSMSVANMWSAMAGQPDASSIF